MSLKVGDILINSLLNQRLLRDGCMTIRLEHFIQKIIKKRSYLNVMKHCVIKKLEKDILIMMKIRY
jgi:hypothetical protein